MTIRNRIARLETAAVGTNEVPPIWWQLVTPEYDGPLLPPGRPKPDWLIDLERELIERGFDPTPTNVRLALGMQLEPDQPAAA